MNKQTNHIIAYAIITLKIVTAQPIFAEEIADKVSIATCNIRHHNNARNVQGKSFVAWDKRVDPLVAQLKKDAFTIIALQQATEQQIKELAHNLTDYKYVSKGRGASWAGLSKDLHHAFLFDAKTVTCLDYGSFYINDPTSWNIENNGLVPEICMWGKFEHKESGQCFYLYNVDFDLFCRPTSIPYLFFPPSSITGNILGKINLLCKMLSFSVEPRHDTNIVRTMIQQQHSDHPVVLVSSVYNRAHFYPIFHDLNTTLLCPSEPMIDWFWLTSFYQIGSFFITTDEEKEWRLVEKTVETTPSYPNQSNKHYLNISSKKDGIALMNFRIPINLAKATLKLIPKNERELLEPNIDQLLKMIDEKSQGEVITINTMDNGKQFEVTIFIN